MNAVPVVSQQLVLRLVSGTDAEPAVSVNVAQYEVMPASPGTPTCTRRLVGRVVPPFADSVTWMLAVAGKVTACGGSFAVVELWFKLQPTEAPQFV